MELKMIFFTLISRIAVLLIDCINVLSSPPQPKSSVFSLVT